MLVTATFPERADFLRRILRSASPIIPVESRSFIDPVSPEATARSALGMILSETKRLYPSLLASVSPTGFFSLAIAVSRVSPEAKAIMASSNAGNPIGTPPLNSNENPSPNLTLQSLDAVSPNREKASTPPPYSMAASPVEPSRASPSMSTTVAGILSVLPWTPWDLPRTRGPIAVTGLPSMESGISTILSGERIDVILTPSPSHSCSTLSIASTPPERS